VTLALATSAARAESVEDSIAPEMGPSAGPAAEQDSIEKVPMQRLAHADRQSVALASDPSPPLAGDPVESSAPLAASDGGTNTAAPIVEDDTNDPLEGMNRAIFRVNLGIDRVFLRPVALGYRHIVPRVARNSIRHFLNNLDSPPIFINQLLQGELDDAGVTVLRFGVNSTVGVAGFFEVAEDMGLPRHSEDFGQTLGTYGMGEGPYLFLPLIGPAPPRDLTGRVVDYLFDPLTYVHLGSQNYWRFVRVSLDAIDLRERNIDTLDEIERTSVDYYASLRSLYRQTRNNEIRNGRTDIENLPDF
jgi:phospholipid-binding lipoprotein MlaA